MRHRRRTREVVRRPSRGARVWMERGDGQVGYEVVVEMASLPGISDRRRRVGSLRGRLVDAGHVVCPILPA